MMILIKIILALILTIIIETLFAYIINIRDKNDILYIIEINTITNVLLNMIILFFRPINIFIVILEIIIIIIEALFHKKKLHNNRINPYLLSIILNILSYSIGLLLSI